MHRFLRTRFNPEILLSSRGEWKLELLLFLPRSSNIRAIFSRPLKAPSDESGLRYRKLRILANRR